MKNMRLTQAVDEAPLLASFINWTSILDTYRTIHQLHLHGLVVEKKNHVIYKGMKLQDKNYCDN